MLPAHEERRTNDGSNDAGLLVRPQLVNAEPGWIVPLHGHLDEDYKPDLKRPVVGDLVDKIILIELSFSPLYIALSNRQHITNYETGCV
jgi:hypothetical protein